MSVLFLEYPKCSTCQRAKKWLDERGLQAETREKPKKEAPLVDYVAEAERDLSNKLGRACHIAHGRKKGKLEITYYGVDDLNALLEALGRLEWGGK